MVLRAEHGFSEGTGTTSASTVSGGQAAVVSGTVSGGFSGRPSSAASSWTTGKNGGGILATTASKSAVVIPVNWGFGGTTSWTAMGWFKVPALASGNWFELMGYVNSTGSENYYLEYARSGSTYSMAFDITGPGGGWSIAGGATVTWDITAWHHVAIVRNGTSAKVYVDGTEVITTTSAGATTDTQLHNVQHYALFANTSPGTWPSVDEWRLFDTALTQAEVTTWRSAGVGAASLSANPADSASLSDSVTATASSPLAPTRVGVSSYQNTGTTAVPVVNPAGAAAGDKMLLLVTINQNFPTLATLSGWTLLTTVTYNSRRSFILARDWASSYADMVLSAASTAGSTIMAIRATSGYTLGDPTLGTSWDRPSNGGSITTTQAPSVTAPANSLALALFSETSTPTETEAAITLSGAGWTKWHYGDTDAAQAAAANHLIAYSEATGATGTATSTWPNASNNSFGVQALYTQTSSGGGPATGMIGAHGAFALDTTYLTVGADRLGGTVTEAVLFDSTGTTELDRETITHDGTTGWGSATFSGLTANTAYLVRFVVDSITQTDVQVTARTTPSAATSWKGLAGSCQFTGSNHPVFDVMKAENAGFLSHQGDLHYEDATAEPAWRAGMESSLNSVRMKSMLETTPMVWTPDNHDVIRTTPLGGGSAVTAASWKQMEGTTGAASSDSLGRAWRMGRVLCIQTDMRSARDNYQTVAEPRSFLGATQKAWFLAQLTAAANDPTILVVLWFSTWTARNDESGRWQSYPTESDSIEAHINALPNGGKAKIIMIGGDSHVLQADSGARTGSVFRFHGIPSLNMSGFNRSSNYATGGWDIAEADLRTSGQPEADWGGYSRIVVTDAGGPLTFHWDAVRVNAAGATDVMASFERVYSGTTTVTPADSAGLSDAVTATETMPRALADTAGLTDAVAVAETMPRTQGDTLGLTDAATPAASRPRGLADTAALADMVALGRSALPNDPATLGDVVTAVVSAGRQLADGVGLTDTVSATLGASVSLADTLALGDAAARTASAGRAGVDAAGLSDLVTRTLSAGRSQPDAVGLTDEVSIELTTAGETLVQDGLAIGDQVVSTVQSQRAPADGVGLSDSVTAALTRVVTVADFLALTDSASVASGASSALADTLALTDQVLLIRNTSRPLSDGAGLTDTISLQRTVGVLIADTLNVTDAAAATWDGYVPTPLPDDLTVTLVPLEMATVTLLDEYGSAIVGCVAEILEKHGDTRTRSVILNRSLAGLAPTDIRVLISGRAGLVATITPTIVDAAGGEVSFQLGALPVGYYVLEIEVTTPTEVSTHPTNGYVQVKIEPDLGP